MRRQTRSLVLVVLSSFGLGGTAHAGGFLVARFGGEHGHPTTSDPSALYYNPAGLALTSGTRVYIDGSFALRTATYDRPAGAIDHVGTGTPTDGVSVNSGRATLSNAIASPFFGVATDFGQPDLAVGLSFSTPFGGPSVWDSHDTLKSSPYPGAVDGPQRWASIDGTIRSSYVTLGGAYRIAPARLSIGIAANLVLSQLNTVRARNGNGSDDLVSSSGAVQEGRSVIDVSGTTGSIGAGLVWQPIDELWIGASYQSQPGFGEMKMEGTLDSKLAGAPMTHDKVDVLQSLPDVVRWGGRYRPTKQIEVRLFGDFARWSVFDKQCLLNQNDPKRSCKLNPDGTIDTAGGGSGVTFAVPRNWKNTFGVRAGGSYWVTPEVEAFVGGGYDSNAVPSSTIDPALFDMNKGTASAGARVTLLEQKLVVDATFTQVFYASRTVAPRARDATGEGVSVAPPSRQPDMAGTYSQAASVLVVGVGYTF